MCFVIVNVVVLCIASLRRRDDAARPRRGVRFVHSGGSDPRRCELRQCVRAGARGAARTAPGAGAACAAVGVLHNWDLLKDPMPRAPEAPIDSEGQLAEVGALQCTRGRQLTARCCGDSQRGGVTVLAVFGAMAAVIVVSHALADTSYRGPPKPPPPPCGTWAIIDGRESGPGERPCSRCKYGAEFTHVVTTDDLNNDKNKRYGPCDTLADRFGVPQFEIWNLNKSTSCCENPLHVEVTDVLEICKPPTLAQWKAEGHPKKAPKKVVFSYIGALGGAIAPLPTWAPLCCQSNACKNNEDCRAEGNQLPDSINVAVIGPIDDTTSTTGVFRVTPPIRGIGATARIKQFSWYHLPCLDTQRMQLGCRGLCRELQRGNQSGGCRAREAGRAGGRASVAAEPVAVK